MKGKMAFEGIWRLQIWSLVGAPHEIGKILSLSEVEAIVSLDVIEPGVPFDTYP